MNQELVNAIMPIVVAILFAFVAGGATVAALIALVADRVLKSPVVLSALEKLYNGLSTDWQTVIKDVVAVGSEVTDGVPAEGKGVA